MGAITTHVLDTARGLPAADVQVQLKKLVDGSLVPVASAVTDSDGRVKQLTAGIALEIGEYQITFEVGDYLAALGQTGFFPRVSIDFIVTDAAAHYHVPLLLSPFGYSTYRGS